MTKKQPIPKYNFKSIEKKWQKSWKDSGVFRPDLDKAKKPFHNLMMFPYPSAEGLHVGNMYAFTGADVYGRFKKLEGYDVFEPIGLDGFGIHSENYAMKIGEHISDVSKRSEKNFYRQLHEIGNMYDWSRTVETYKPNYYKWTQWIFLQMFKKGLAYQKEAKVNWCPSCKTVLSDEQVIAGKCERCDSVVEKKELKQWFFAITKYADQLLKNLDWIDWPDDVKTNQRNWIGKSKGLEEEWKVKDIKLKLKTFTTWPHTTWGATFMVVAPEHPVVDELVQGTKYEKGAKDFCRKVIEEKVKDPANVEKKKEGFFTGRYAINHLNGREMPIYTANFAVYEYGTGIVKCTPTHDQRDFEFAKKYKLDLVPVIYPKGEKKLDPKKMKKAYVNEGLMMNAGKFDDMPTKKARKAIGDFSVEKGNGKWTVNYKLRDWCISRQRYWGPPIPIVWCKRCALGPHLNPPLSKGRKKEGLKRIKVLMIHGSSGRTKAHDKDYVEPNVRHWHSWLEKELKKNGFEVINPIMPTDWKPDYEDWKETIDNFDVDEDTILVGTSAGGAFILKWLSETGRKARNVILNAPSKKLVKREERIKGFVDFKIDSSLKNQIESLTIFISNDKTHRVESAEMISNKLGAKLIKLKGRKHFCVDDNPKNKKFPELLEKIQESIEPVAVSVPEEDLPVKLPPMEDFLPEGKGKGPLAKNEKFVKVKCPVCEGDAERETDVSDPFLDSAWYFFRYPSTEFNEVIFDRKRTKKWLPVDSYIGGKEHTVLHLLYSRFMTMVLKDLGYIDFDEPYKRFFGHGLITKDGTKMSKSKGNVVNPDDAIKKYGADTVRLYLRFVGDFAQGGDWRDSGIEGMHKFLNRMWKVFHEVGADDTKSVDDADLRHLQNKTKPLNMSMIDKTIKVVGEDIEKLSFNTAVARIMEYVNWMRDHKDDFNKVQAKKVKETLALVIAPMAPHIAEEFWAELQILRPGKAGTPPLLKGENKKAQKHTSIFEQRWPKFDPKKVIEDEIELVIQVNGKVRDKVMVSKDISEKEAEKIALGSEKVQRHLGRKKPKKVIYVKGRLVNIVT